MVLCGSGPETIARKSYFFSVFEKENLEWLPMYVEFLGRSFGLDNLPAKLFFS